MAYRAQGQDGNWYWFEDGTDRYLGPVQTVPGGSYPEYAQPQVYQPPTPPVGGAALPQTPGPGARATLYTPGFGQLNAPGSTLRTETLWPPLLRRSDTPGTGYLPRWYTMQDVLNENAGVAVTRQIQFNTPCYLLAFTGSAFSTASGNALPVGVTPRSCWSFAASDTTGQQIIVAPIIAENVVGTAERPGFLPGRGWSIPQAGTVTLTVTPYIADLRISVSLLVIEGYAGADVT